MTRSKQYIPLDALGYPDYLAHRYGRVLSLKASEPRAITPARHNKSGRLMVHLVPAGGGRPKAVALARLILTAFGRPSPKGRGYEPVHRNGDHEDCRLANLSWATLPQK